METPSTSLAGKRILYAITKSNWGGAQSYVYTLALAAHASGAHTSVTLGGAGSAGGGMGLLAERLEEARIPITPLSEIRRDIGLMHEWRAFIELVRVIDRKHPEILHLNSSKMGFLGALAGRLVGVPHIVFTAHGWPHRENRSLLWRAAIWFASWITICLSHIVIVVSQCDMETAPVLFSRRKLIHIANGIPPFPLLTRAEARAELAVYAPELLSYNRWILMNSELHPNKGIDVAIRALAMLVAEHPESALVVMSEGQEHIRLTELAASLGISSHIFLLGFVKDARTKLLAGDIFLMPSRKEGLPLALLEAGLAGLPVVASDVGGIPEIIQHGKTGLLVPPKDPAALAAAIASLLRDPSRAEHLGASLHDRIASEFSEEEMVARTFSTYAT